MFFKLRFCVATDNDNADARGVAIDRLSFSTFDLEKIAKEENENEYHRQTYHYSKGEVGSFKGQVLKKSVYVQSDEI